LALAVGGWLFRGKVRCFQLRYFRHYSASDLFQRFPAWLCFVQVVQKYGFADSNADFAELGEW